MVDVHGIADQLLNTQGGTYVLDPDPNHGGAVIEVQGTEYILGFVVHGGVQLLVSKLDGRIKVFHGGIKFEFLYQGATYVFEDEIQGGV